jgi:putative transcriptional regulator
MATKPQTAMSGAIHASAAMLHKAGALDITTMRDFDARHMAMPAQIEPAQIKNLREANSVSQPVFARYLNTSESTVDKWETGATGPAAWRLNCCSPSRKIGSGCLRR